MQVTNQLLTMQNIASKPESQMTSHDISAESTDCSSNSGQSFQTLLQQKGQGSCTQPSKNPDALQLLLDTTSIKSSEDPNELQQALAATLLSNTVTSDSVQNQALTFESLSKSASAAIQSETYAHSEMQPFSAPATSSSAMDLQLDTLSPTIPGSQSQSSQLMAKSQPQDMQIIQNSQPQTDQKNTQSQGDWETLEIEFDQALQTKPIFRETESIPVKVGETPILHTESSEFDQLFAKQINQTFLQGEQRVAIKLTPEHLGTVIVELTSSHDGTLQVVLQASSAKAASMLSEHTPALSQLLQNNTQSPVFVDVQQQQDGSQSYQQQQGNTNQDAQQQQQQNHQQRKHNQDFLEQLRLGMISLNPEVS